MKKLLLAFVLLLLGGGGVHAADIQDSVGALYKRDFNNSLAFTCTISAVDHDSKDLVLLTAKHCIDEKQKTGYLVTFDGTTFHNAELYMIPREHPDDPKDVDLALLKVKGGVDVPKLKVSTDLIKAGTDIVQVGFPLGVAKILYKGILAGRVTAPGHLAENSLILQTFGAPGSSGTSVIEESTGRIIGVFVAVSSSFGTPVMYATPIEYVKYLVTPQEKRKLKKDDYTDDSPATTDETKGVSKGR